MVWVTALPAESVTVARSETNPLPDGWFTRAVRFAPNPVSVAFVQLAPSFSEYCTETVDREPGDEVGCAAAVNGTENVVAAGALFVAFRFGRKVTYHKGRRVYWFHGTVADLNVQTALTEVDSIAGGASRETVASRVYVFSSGGT